LSSLSLQLAKGRFFSKSFSTDTLSIILNESAVTELGILGNPLGVRLTSPDDFLNPPDGKGQYIYTVAGVIKDFHFQTLHEKIAPLYILNVRKFSKIDPLMVVKLKAGNYRESIKVIESTWKKFILQTPFHFSFLDQKIADMYAADATTQKIFTVFSVMAIIIACMGLLGLITYTVQVRIKEIGIRKVLGASVSNILWLLGNKFFRIIILAGLIAFPIAFMLMNKWLQGFEYRVNMNPWTFIFALFIVILIAFITIGLQALKAALSNPIKSLRTE
jgi:putative ABC transport system permease protein